MYPHESLLVFFDDIQLVSGHVLLTCEIYLLLSLDQSLTWSKHHALWVLLVQLVCKMGAKACVKVL